MKKILQFIDRNILFALSLFFIILIPLYPKWPMFDALPGYNVRIRLEDFLVLFAFMVWGIQVLRKKIILKEIPLYKPILAYAIVGFLSTLSAIFITQTVTTESYQILKLYLHYARRLEYFSLFFIFYSAIHSKEQIKYYIGTLVVAILGVSTYGFGQKYLYWPAYSTMNREFSKGITLYLSEHARVLSTFGGHYDLAAYVMMTLTIIIVIAFSIKKWWLSLLLLLLALFEYWILILTASRTSFIAFLAAITVAFFFLALKRGYWWSGIRWFAVVFVSMAIMLTVGPLSERFAHVIKLQDLKTNLNKAFNPPPVNGIALDENLTIEQQLEIVATKSDTPPSTVRPGGTTGTDSTGGGTDGTGQRPADVYSDPYAHDPVTGEILTPEQAATAAAQIHVDYSENALKYGLSTGIRLDALWPRAIAGFRLNPLLGSGYSTLVKERVWEQTPAESTDNDYLRMLGETGILGFFTFMLIFAVCILISYQALIATKDKFYIGLFASGIGIIVGLMVNAIYIDIFESSKVAYTFWSLMGVVLAAAAFTLKGKKTAYKPGTITKHKK